MKRKELFWMFAPCLLLAGAWLWLWRQEKANERYDGPIRTVVKNVSLLQTSPLEEAAGFDHKIEVIVSTEGKLPPGASRLINSMEVKVTEPRLYLGDSPFLSVPEGHLHITSDSGFSDSGFKAIVLLKLSAIPPSSKELILKMKLELIVTTERLRSGVYKPVPIRSLPAQASFIVRNERPRKIGQAD